jgi:hypothetical protein
LTGTGGEVLADARTGTFDHSLFVFNQLGDPERCALRPGNVRSADAWPGVLEPVIARYRAR